MSAIRELDLDAIALRLSWDECDILQALDDKLWCRPMDLGASDGSFHSRWLAKLVRLALAERKDRGGLAGARPSYVYRRSALGTQVNARIQKATPRIGESGS